MSVTCILSDTLDRCAVREVPEFWGPRRDQDLGRIVLVAGAPVHVRVTAEGQAIPDAAVNAWAVIKRDGDWEYYYAGAARTTVDGRAFLGVLPPGRVRLSACAEGRGRGVATLDVPQHVDPVIALTLAVDLIVRVVDGSTRAPVPGAMVMARESVGYSSIEALPPLSESVPTDSDGITVLRGLSESDRLNIDVRATGYPRTRGWRVSPKRSAGRVEIALERTTTLRWRVADGGAPPDGTRVRILPADSEWLLPLSMSEGIIEGGVLSVPRWPERSDDWTWAFAVAPDGAIAKLIAPRAQYVWDPVKFIPGRRLTVRLRERDGRPAVGYWVSAGQSASPTITLNCGPVATDEEGRAELSGLYGEPALHVRATRWDMNPEYHSLGTVNLEVADAALDRYLPPARLVRVAVIIDGHPELPASYDLSSGAWSGYVTQGVHEFPEEAELRYRTRDDGDPWLTVPGYTRVSTDEAAFPWGPAIEVGELRKVVSLARSAQLIVRLANMASLADMGGLALQRQAEGAETWFQEWIPQGAASSEASETRQPSYYLAEGGLLSIHGLEPGRVRLVLRRTGAVFGPFDLRAGATADASEIDVSAADVVRGQVLLPDGVAAHEVRLTVDGAVHPKKHRWQDDEDSFHLLSADGRFELTVPPRDTHVLRVAHPFCRPVAPVIVVRGSGPAVIALDALPRVSFKLAQTSDTTAWYDPPLVLSGGMTLPKWKPESCVRVVLRARGSDRDSEPAFTFEPSAYRFDKPGQLLTLATEAGTYGAWISVPGLAPLLIDGLAIEPGVHDLGTRPFDEGTILTVQVLPEEGVLIDGLSADAVFQGQPQYARRPAGKRKYGDLSPLVLAGLGAGQFTVRVAGSYAGTPDGLQDGGRWERTSTINVDGRSRQELRVRVGAGGRDPDAVGQAAGK